MFDSDQDGIEQPRKRAREVEGLAKYKPQEEREHGGRRSEGHEEEGEFGSTSGMKGRGSRGSYRNRGRVGRGRGRHNRGRGRPAGKQEEREPSPARKYRKTLEKKIQFAEQAYRENTNKDIRRIIQDLEEEVAQAQSGSEMEDWEYLLPDPGNTRGRMTLYKQALHLYWLMKRLLAKAMEQVAIEMVELSQGIPNLKRELKNIQITMMMQDKKLDEIQQQIENINMGITKEDEQKEAMRGNI